MFLIDGPPAGALAWGMTRAFADRPAVTVADAPGKPAPAVDTADAGLRVGGDLGAVPAHAAGAAPVGAAGAMPVRAGSAVPVGVAGAVPVRTGGAAPVQPAGAVPPRPATAAALDDLRRERADFLRRSADYYGDPHLPVDGTLVDRVLDSWYRMIAGEQDDDGLRAAYRDAVSVLMTRAAGALEVPLDDLYRANRGRIPMWAWPEPHHLVAGIRTPIPDGHEPEAATGAVRLTVGTVTVSILPDEEADDVRAGGRARDAGTRLDYTYELPAYTWESRKGKKVVTSFEPAVVAFTIRTRRRPGVRFPSPSKYGRGTTAEDLAGAKVDPYSGTLGFHEGQHGMDLVEFLRSHEPPAYPGKVGMTVRRFEGLRESWLAALHDYAEKAEELSAARTDRVGVPESEP
ncbi:hypothetical protein ACQP2F_19075 [Actinoplanes sp. CA-030573]|uniref:hypothetical protein n=1 Tax=Actinoplanes sp. CA-030573 TaxID=3239898 RepID=UPI003D8D8FB2